MLQRCLELNNLPFWFESANPTVSSETRVSRFIRTLKGPSVLKVSSGGVKGMEQWDRFRQEGTLKTRCGSEPLLKETTRGELGYIRLL